MATGIIQDSMGQPEGDSADALSPEVIKQNTQIPPELQGAYDRVVVAGMKLMFAKESRNFITKKLTAGDGPIGEKLGKSIAGLMLILFMESNKTLPPQLMVPAGLELLAQGADFLRKSGLAKVSNKDFGDAAEVMISTIMEKFGVTKEKLQAMFTQYDNQKANAAAPGAAPQQPPMGA